MMMVPIVASAAARSANPLSSVLVVLSIIGAFLGLVGIVGGGYAWFTVSKHKALVEIWRGEAEAEKTRGDRIERENGRIDKENVDIKSRLAASEAAVKVLTEQISGRREVAELREEIRSQYAGYQQQHIETAELLTRMITTLAEGFQPRD